LLGAVLAALKVKSGDSFTIQNAGASVSNKQGKSEGPVVFAIDKTKALLAFVPLRLQYPFFDPLLFAG
jgi:hypothetical protein